MIYTLHPDLAWLPWNDEHIVAMSLPSGEPITLTGTAAALFLDIAAGLDPITEALTRWPEHASDVRSISPGFLRDLVAAGLVVETEDIPADDSAPRRPRRAAPESQAEPRPASEPYRVLFVCTANICRSAYADVVARAAGLDGVEFSSAGTHGLTGHPIDPPMAAEVTTGDPEAHRARQLSRSIAHEADLIICMAEPHRLYVLEEWPAQARKTYVIGHVARELERLPEAVTLTGLTGHLWANRHREPDDSIDDPYSQGQAAAAACARRLDSRLTVILEGLHTLLRSERP